jgi:hypothetical protein
MVGTAANKLATLTVIDLGITPLKHRLPELALAHVKAQATMAQLVLYVRI